MDQQILTKGINELKKVVGESRSQLDIGAMEKIEEVIASLKELRDQPPEATDAATQKLRTLQKVAALVSLMTNVKDWM